MKYSYSNEKNIFSEIKKSFNDKKYEKNIDEFIYLINKLYLTYNPKINENKFIVGHVVEKILVLLLKSFNNFTVEQMGSNKFGWDLLINNFKFSIKSSSKPKSEIRLINYHGNDNKENISYSTILLELGTGIIYFDPKDIEDYKINFRKSTDGLSIKGTDVHKIINNSGLIIKLPDLKSKHEIYLNNTIAERTASDLVFEKLLEEHSKILINFLD